MAPPRKPTLSVSPPDEAGPLFPGDEALDADLEDELEDEDPGVQPSDLVDSLAHAYSALLSSEGLLPAPPANAGPALKAVWEAYTLARSLAGARVDDDAIALELQLAKGTAEDLAASEDLTPEQRSLAERVVAIVSPHIPDRPAGADEDLTWEELFDLDAALDFAEALPDAAVPGGAERTPEVVLAWLDDNHPGLPEDTREALSETIAAFDLGELRGPTHRFAVRAVALFDGGDRDPYRVHLVGVGSEEAIPLTETEVFDLDPKLSDDADKMRLVAALLDGLSDYVEDGQTFSLSPPFAALAKPFGAMRVGTGLSPADRRQARAERVRAMKRRR